MKKNYFIVVFIVTAGVNVAPALSAPILDNSLIQVRQFENFKDATPHTIFNQTTTNGSLSNNLDSVKGSNIQAYGEFATGKTGTQATITSLDTNNIESRVSIFDTLTFDTVNGLPSEITYQLSFDGTLSNHGTGPFGGFAEAQASVSIYDITGLDTWLDDFDQENPIIFTSVGASLISKIKFDFVVGSQAFIDGFTPFSSDFDELIVDTSGTQFEFDLTKDTAFIADPAKQYGIQILTRSLATDVSSSCIKGDATL